MISGILQGLHWQPSWLSPQGYFQSKWKLSKLIYWLRKHGKRGITKENQWKINKNTVILKLGGHLGVHLELWKMLNDVSLTSFRFWFYTTSSTKISNNLVGGYFCKVHWKMATWHLDYYMRHGDQEIVYCCIFCDIICIFTKHTLYGLVFNVK